MVVSVQTINGKLYLTAGAGGWAGTTDAELFGDGVPLAQEAFDGGHWKRDKTAAMAFADWIQDNAESLATDKPFEWGKVAFWVGVGQEIARRAETFPTPLPRWA